MLLDLERILGPQTMSVSQAYIDEQARTILALCEEVKVLREIAEYADCDSWRCEHNRLRGSDECVCGLKELKAKWEAI